MKLVKLQGANTKKALFVNAQNVTVVKTEVNMEGSSLTVVVTEHGSHRVDGKDLDVAKLVLDEKFVQFTELNSNTSLFVNPKKVTVIKTETDPNDQSKRLTMINTVKGSYAVVGTLSDAVKKLETTGIVS